MREFRRLKTILNLTYDTSPEQMEAFVEGIKAIVKANSNFRQDYCEIHFHALGRTIRRFSICIFLCPRLE